jgi:AcrR family transcriptional regulator
MRSRPYHHGALRAALITSALQAIAEVGPAGWSLRDLARRAGVSHAAPAHHFGDKKGLLTAIAVDGYLMLAAELDRTWQETRDFAEIGVAYVRFAVSNRAHFEVMFRPELLRSSDPALEEVRRVSSTRLYGPIEAMRAADPSFETTAAATAAWSLVHGLASLWLGGNLPRALGDDPETIARSVVTYLFRPLPARGRSGVG